jgi:hypothetical protein
MIVKTKRSINGLFFIAGLVITTGSSLYFIRPDQFWINMLFIGLEYLLLAGIGFVTKRKLEKFGSIHAPRRIGAVVIICEAFIVSAAFMLFESHFIYSITLVAMILLAITGCIGLHLQGSPVVANQTVTP